jgi:hypothetical protein
MPEDSIVKKGSWCSPNIHTLTQWWIDLRCPAVSRRGRPARRQAFPDRVDHAHNAGRGSDRRGDYRLLHPQPTRQSAGDEKGARATALMPASAEVMPSLIAEICEFGSCPYDAQALFSAIDPAHPSPPFGVPHANTACSGNVCAYPSLRRRQLLLHLKQRFEWSHGLIFLSAVCRGQAHRSSDEASGYESVVLFATIARAVCNYRGRLESYADKHYRSKRKVGGFERRRSRNRGIFRREWSVGHGLDDYREKAASQARLNDLQRSPHGSLGALFVRAGPAEIGQATNPS